MFRVVSSHSALLFSVVCVVTGVLAVFFAPAVQSAYAQGGGSCTSCQQTQYCCGGVCSDCPCDQFE